jgi:ribokinase
MIVVFGSINADLVMIVDSLPRAGETVLCPSYQVAPGGKGANQAAAAARAGAKVAMFGQVGTDGFGDLAVRALADAGVDTGGVLRARAPTGCAAIGVDKAGENQIIVASGANLCARADQVPDALLGPETTLVLQLEVPVEEIARLAARAGRRGARIIFNAAPAGPVPDALLRSVDILVVNEFEAETLCQGIGGQGTGGPVAAARGLAETLGVICAVTLGGEGARAFGPEGAWTVDALKITPVDTTGAGDAFVGVLAASLDAARGFEESLHRASVGAGLACLAEGAQSALPDGAAIDKRLSDLAPAKRLDGP